MAPPPKQLLQTRNLPACIDTLLSPSALHSKSSSISVRSCPKYSLTWVPFLHLHHQLSALNTQFLHLDSSSTLSSYLVNASGFQLRYRFFSGKVFSDLLRKVRNPLFSTLLPLHNCIYTVVCEIMWLMSVSYCSMAADLRTRTNLFSAHGFTPDLEQISKPTASSQ